MRHRHPVDKTIIQGQRHLLLKHRDLCKNGSVAEFDTFWVPCRTGRKHNDRNRLWVQPILLSAFRCIAAHDAFKMIKTLSGKNEGASNLRRIYKSITRSDVLSQDPCSTQNTEGGTSAFNLHGRAHGRHGNRSKTGRLTSPEAANKGHRIFIY